MSECQAKAGNQECFENLKTWKPENLKIWKLWKHEKWSLVHAGQLLFSCLCSKVTVYSRKLKCFFFDIISRSSTLSTDIRVHRAGSQLKMPECQTKAGNLDTFSLSHSVTLSLSLPLLFTHSRHAEQLLFSCLCSKVTLSLSDSHTLLLFHSLSTCWTTFVFMSRLKCHSL